MVQYNPLQYLPTAEELPDSDDTPVDNELQLSELSLCAAGKPTSVDAKNRARNLV